jgi:hypothetical protein
MGNGWLHRIDQGGWRALESTRDGFLSGLDERLAEYLVVGQNDCLNVLSRAEPEVE